MLKIMQHGIFTLFVCVSMATVNMQTDVEQSLGNYDILPFLCECKMHDFKISENLRLK